MTFGGDIGRGFVNISHHSFAMLGLLALILSMLALARPEVRTLTVQSVQGWLFTRLHISEAEDEQQQVLLRSLAAPATDLTPLQLTLVQAVRNKYKIAPEPLNALMLEVFDLADRSALDATLILAVIGVESNFNPFANSPTGAKGLMQVIPEVHSEQFTPYGGAMAIFDPKTNLRIGVKILKECINLTGSLEEGLRLYKAGEESVSQESEYIARVMAEQERLKQAIPKNPKDANAKAIPNPSPKKWSEAAYFAKIKAAKFKLTWFIKAPPRLHSGCAQLAIGAWP